MNCDWKRNAETGVWECGRPGCGQRAKAKFAAPPLSWCRGEGMPPPPRPPLAIVAGTPCPLAPILLSAPPTASPAAYVSRLHRCRAADCKLLHLVDGRMVCVGRGRSCQWLGEWARFLAGEEECPHWPATAPAGCQ